MPRSSAIYRQVAELHIQGLDSGFLGRLGPRFVTLLYEAIDTNPDTHLIIETDADRVLGFVSGGARMAPVYRNLLAQFPRLMMALFPALLRPSIVRGIFDILCYRKQGDDRTQSTLPRHELFSIVVAPAARGQGAADRLYDQLRTAFRAEGATAFRIVVGDQLAQAHSFYTRMGARAVDTTRLHGDAQSIIYVDDV